MSMVSVVAGGTGMLSHSGAEATRVATASPLLRQFEYALSSSATFVALSSLCSSLSRLLGCFSDCCYAIHVIGVIIGGVRWSGGVVESGDLLQVLPEFPVRFHPHRFIDFG